MSAGVEILQFGGGLAPRALLGGTFTPGGSKLNLEVGSSGALTLGAPRLCESLLAGPLVRGLPSDFVDAIIQGVAVVAQVLGQEGGTLRVDAGGYDEENSSNYAFRHAGAALMWLVNKRLVAPKVPVESVAELISIW